MGKKYQVGVILAVILVLALCLMFSVEPTKADTAGNSGSFVMPKNGYVTSITITGISVSLDGSESVTLYDGSTAIAYGTGSVVSGDITISVTPVFVYAGHTYSLVVTLYSSSGSSFDSVYLTYTPYYLVTVTSAYGSPTTSAYVQEGSDYSISVTSPEYGPEASGARYKYTCTGYSIDGGGLIAGTSLTLGYVTSDHTVVFSWSTTTQYYMTVTSSYGTTTGSGWYDSGATAYAGLTSSTASGGAGTQYVFSVWSVGGTNYSQSNPITVTYPISVSASWNTQYYLTVTSPYSTTGGSGYYNSGSLAYASVATNIVIDGDGTHTLQGWTNDASGSGLTSNAITMSAPKTATASWVTTGGGGGSTNYTVTLHGPFYEDGTAASGETITCTLLYANSTIYSFSMNSSLGTYDNQTITSTSPFVQLQWNASSAQNYTRIYRFITNTTSDEVNLYIVRSTQPSFIYTFSVTDFYGMINPYLEVRISPDGSNSYIVERADLSEGGTVTFVLTQYQLYTLSFVCDQGTYTQSFTASIQGTPGQYAVTLNILSGNFPSSSSVTNATATAYRINGTAISVTYVDPDDNTSWVYLQISHMQGSTEIIDYIVNSTGSIQSFSWLLADSTTDYLIEVQAYINGEVQVWHLTATITASSNPWTGVFDWLGNAVAVLPEMHMGWPEGMTGAQIAQIAGAIIVALFLCIGSFRSAGACAIISWLMFGILIVMGWFGTVTPWTIPSFAVSGFFAIIVALEEGKREVREV